MGAGILPITVMRGTIFFLLGKERNNLWSDFGGSSNLNEYVFDTAIREGYEELDGLLGNEKEMNNLVLNNLITCCKTERYTTYVFYVKPDLICNMPFYFNNYRNFLKNELLYYNEKDYLFEKIELKLFTKNDLKNNYNSIRPFYKDIILQLLNIENTPFYHDLINKKGL